MLGVTPVLGLPDPSGTRSARKVRVMHGTIQSPGAYTLEVEVLLPSFSIEVPRLGLDDDLPRVCPSCGAVVPGGDEPDWAAAYGLYDCWHQGCGR
jgi:hypothetical protein